MSAVEIRSNHGVASVLVDGVDLAPTLSGLTLEMGLHGRCEITLELIPVDVKTVGEAKVTYANLPADVCEALDAAKAVAEWIDMRPLPADEGGLAAMGLSSALARIGWQR